MWEGIFSLLVALVGVGGIIAVLRVPWNKCPPPAVCKPVPEIDPDSIPPMPKCKPPKSDDHEEISQREALSQILEKIDEHSSKIVKAVEDLKYGHHGTGPR